MSTAGAMINLRIDNALKQQATKDLKAMGLTISDAVRMMLTRVAAEHALPFEVRVPKTTVSAVKELRSGKCAGRAKTAAEMFAECSK